MVHSSLPDAFALGKLRKDDCKHSGSLQIVESFAGMVRPNKFEQLITDPFRTDLCQGVPQTSDGNERFLLNGEVELSGNSASPEHAQCILSKALVRFSDCPDRSLLQVFHAPIQIDDASIKTIHCKSIDREVPSLQILCEASHIGHRAGVPSVEIVSFTAEGGNFEALLFKVYGDCPVVDAGGNHMAEQ
ncbi:hypothetical protein SDC9_170876 [bioreactor metagenome]|uniref:Uncharacterized protein n=1 Tax=bioreactor metagenome TaxID=1076179 RepID=A0A645G9B3_9ZZZZ